MAKRGSEQLLFLYGVMSARMLAWQAGKEGVDPPSGTADHAVLRDPHLFLHLEPQDVSKT